MELRSGENPARWRGHLDHLLPKRTDKKQHLPVLTYAELPAFMAELRREQGFAARAWSSRPYRVVLLLFFRELKFVP